MQIVIICKFVNANLQNNKNELKSGLTYVNCGFCEPVTLGGAPFECRERTSHNKLR